MDNLYMILSLAIRKNSSTLAKKALEKHETINYLFGLDCRDYFLLIQALQKGRKKIAKLLLMKNCKVNCSKKTNFFLTPLYYAIRLGDSEIVSMLLRRGALINGKDFNKETALTLAFRQKQNQLVKLMLSEYFIQNKISYQNSQNHQCQALKDIKKNHFTAYCIACLSNNQEAIENFMKKKKFFTKLKNNHTWFKEKHKLHFAVKNGFAELVDLLLINGEDVTEKNEDGMTPLHLAYINSVTNPVCGTHDYSRIIDLLLQAHNEKTNNCTDRNGLSHFHIACTRNNFSVVKTFLKGKVNVNKMVSFHSPVCKGFTPLHYAACSASFDVISLLLQENAEVNKPNGEGVTPLHMIFSIYTAADHLRRKKDRCKKILNQILSNESNIKNYVSYKGLSYFHIACSLNDIKTVNSLVKQGEKISQPISLNSKILPGFTPLHCAVWFQNLEVIDLLLKHNADLNATCAEGLTPLHLAWLKNNHSVEIDINCVDTIKIYNVYNLIGVHSINDLKVTSTIVDALLSSHSNKNHFKNSVDRRRGISHFHIACTRNNLRAIRDHLIMNLGEKNSSFVNKKTFLNSLCVLSLATPLHCAVKYNKLSVVDLLLRHGADVHAVNENGWTPLLEACQFSYYKIYELIFDCIISLENCASESLFNTLQKSCEFTDYWKLNRLDNLKIIDLLLKHGSDVNIKDRFCEPLLLKKITDSENFFIVIDKLTENLLKNNLIKSRTFDIIREMIQKEFKIRRKEIIKVLLDYNVDTNACDYKKNTILHLLANDANLDDDIVTIFEMLLIKGANINAKNVNGSTPLHIAVKNRGMKIEFLKLLIKQSANVNAVDEDGKTPLHLLCKNSWSEEKNEKIIEILVSAGAEIDAKDKHGLSPLYTACLSNNKKIVLQLLNFGANINIEYLKNKTIVHYLCDYYPSFNRLEGEIYKVIKNHVIKLKALGLFISKSLEKIFYEDLSFSNNIRSTPDGKISYQEYSEVLFHQCSHELMKMKNHFIQSNTSLYDILFENPNQMMIHVKNDAFLNALSLSNFNVEFPNYGYLLKLQLTRGLKRKALIGSAENGFIKIVKINLPDLCTEKILKYLNNLDLESLSQL